MENVTKTVSIETLAQILTVGTTSNSTSTANTEAHATETANETAHTEANATETAHAHTTECASAHATCNHISATVSHCEATEEVRESLMVSIAINEDRFEGELSEIWAAVRNNEINLNELFSTELSFVNGCLSIAIAPRVATV